MLPIEQGDGRAVWGIHTYALTSSCHAYTLSRNGRSGGRLGDVFRRSWFGHLRWHGGCGPSE